MAAERQAELRRELEGAMGMQTATGSARVVALRTRTVRLVRVGALALTPLIDGLLSPAGEVAADSAGGGASVAEGGGYVP
jgi:hypothetical protein